MLELSFLYVYPSILTLQASKMKEIVKSIMLMSLSSHDKVTRTVFVTRLMD